MPIPILVEPIDGGRFRARTGAPFDIVVEGSSRHDALQRMQLLIQTRRNQGWEIHMVEVGTPQNLSGLAGMWDPNDPFIKEWKEAVEEYRKKCDEGPDFPWLEHPETQAS